VTLPAFSRSGERITIVGVETGGIARQAAIEGSFCPRLNLHAGIVVSAEGVAAVPSRAPQPLPAVVLQRLDRCRGRGPPHADEVTVGDWTPLNFYSVEARLGSVVQNQADRAGAARREHLGELQSAESQDGRILADPLHGPLCSAQPQRASRAGLTWADHDRLWRVRHGCASAAIDLW